MMQLIKRKNQPEFFTGERCYITEILNDPANCDLSLARCRVLPGVTTQLHALSAVCETYLIEHGTGVMDGGAGRELAVAPGDTVTIAPGQAQRIRNTSEVDLVFMVICRPRFTPECYVNLEDI